MVCEFCDTVFEHRDAVCEFCDTVSERCDTICEFCDTVFEGHKMICELCGRVCEFRDKTYERENATKIFLWKVFFSSSLSLSLS